MPIRWRLFWIICLLQMLAASFFTISALIDFFALGSFSAFARILLFLLIVMLSIFAISVLNSNYPDVPVTGRQKTHFNRLFLVNFLFLAFLFAVLFSEYRDLKAISELIDRPFFQLPSKFLAVLFIYGIILLFQLIILYGLYVLRRELYINFASREFDFEKNQ